MINLLYLLTIPRETFMKKLLVLFTLATLVLSCQNGTNTVVPDRTVSLDLLTVTEEGFFTAAPIELIDHSSYTGFDNINFLTRLNYSFSDNGAVSLCTYMLEQEDDVNLNGVLNEGYIIIEEERGLYSYVNCVLDMDFSISKKYRFYDFNTDSYTYSEDPNERVVNNGILKTLAITEDEMIRAYLLQDDGSWTSETTYTTDGHDSRHLYNVQITNDYIRSHSYQYYKGVLEYEEERDFRINEVLPEARELIHGKRNWYEVTETLWRWRDIGEEWTDPGYGERDMSSEYGRWNDFIFRTDY